MNIHYITKPNFKPHPLNYVFMVVFFFVGFFPAQAFAGDSYYLWTSNGYTPGYGKTPAEACSDFGGFFEGTCYFNADHTGGYAAGSWGQCYAPTPYFDSSLPTKCSGTIPPPPVAEDCEDLTGQTASVRSGNLSLCISGCLASTTGGVTVQLGSGESSSNTYTYTGGTCNATPNVPWQQQYKDAFDGTDHQEPDESQVQKDDEGQHNCYTADGKYLGRVSIKVNCPTDQQRCYNNDTGKFTNTIGPGQSCATGASTKQAADRDTLKKWNENTVTNPDGSTTTTTTETTTETGADGSKHTTTTTTTGGKNADGSDKEETESTTKNTSDTNENTKETISGLTNCGTKPKCAGDVLDCASIQIQWATYCDGQGAEVGGLDNCASPPTCKGDALGCAVINQNWKASCQLSQSKLDEALTNSDYVAAKAGATLDDSGGLSGIYEQVNVNDALNLGSVLGDNGRSGSCPSDVPLPFSMATQYFKYDSICQMMDALRPLVLFAAAFFCVMMIYRGIVEQT
jgi:hypothetical protein